MNPEVETTRKRKQSDENSDDEHAQKFAKTYSTEDIKLIENLHNIILEVKRSLNDVYQSTGLKLKNGFESIHLFVPELKKDMCLPPMSICLESDEEEQSSEEPKKSKNIPQHLQNPSPLKKSAKSSSSGSVVAKWTLKHQGPGPGLIELMPNTGIYISEEVLTRYKLIYTDMRKFARALLGEIFSKEGIRKCSFSGYGANGKPPKNPGTTCPGLDEYARNVFLEYVTQHAEESGWEIVSRKLMFQALSNKVKNLRQYLINL